MHLYRFTDDKETIVSAASQLKAVEIYEAETGELHNVPSQLYGNVIFSFCGDLPTSLPETAVVAGTSSESCAIADADAWAAHWPNRVVEFGQMWGGQ